MGLSENQSNSYMPTSTGAGGQVVVMECPNHRISNKKLHILKKIKKRFGLVRRSPSSCPGPNNLPPLQFHSVHGDNIRISRDGTLARRFESFCRAITFSARPVRINERICVRFTEISNNWNGGIRFGFTSNDPATLEGALPKYACPDLTNRPGFWAKALHEQYCEKDNILYYYVNSAGDVIYGINNVEKGVILSGIDTRSLLWTLVDIYGNCTAIEFLDARVYMYQQNGNVQVSASATLPVGNIGIMSGGGGGGGTLPGPQIPLNPHHPHQQSRRSLPVVEQDLDRHVLPSMQSLNISMDQMPYAQELANGLPPLRYNANGRLIPVPFHITKGRNVRLSLDRFIASRTENDFCQGYVFTARPIRIGEKVIVQILKTEQMYLGALALGLTSCNPAALQSSDLPNDSDFLLDRPEYWVVSKDIASQPQRGDEIAFFIAPNGEVTISKNNGPAVVVMHVDQSLQLWAFLDVYGSTQSVRMFRQQLPNMVNYPQQPLSAAPSTQRLPQHSNISIAESMNSLNSQMSESRKMLHTSALTVASHNTMNSSMAALSSTISGHCNIPAGTVAAAVNSTPINNTNGNNTATATGHMISMPSSGDLIQIQPNGGGTVLVVNLPPANSTHELNSINGGGVASTRQPTSGVLAGACSAIGTSQYIEPVSSLNDCHSNQEINKWKDTVDHSGSSGNGSATAECTICYENQIDSVLYMCGHMCMCYDCAIEQWRGVGGGQCPLCRAVIRDVIRTYTT